MKKFILLALLLFFPCQVSAYTIKQGEQVYVSGESVGIKLHTDVTIVETYNVLSDGQIYKPWQAKLNKGDIIKEVNGVLVQTVEEVKTAMAKDCNSCLLKIVRNGLEKEVVAKPILKDDGQYSLGLFLRDNVMGVGTMTYIIPSTNVYGSLGHSISSQSYEGDIYSSTVTGIIKSSNGNVGEKEVVIDNEVKGSVTLNTETGIHGYVDSWNTDLRMYPIAKKEEIHNGPATFLTAIDETGVQEFKIEIKDLYSQKEKATKSMKIKVVDEELLKRTGGIVQGMSGSPIIQDGKIVGALTHVIVGNTQMGYGIYVEWMLEEMDIFLE